MIVSVQTLVFQAVGVLDLLGAFFATRLHGSHRGSALFVSLGMDFAAPVFGKIGINWHCGRLQVHSVHPRKPKHLPFWKKIKHPESDRWISSEVASHVVSVFCQLPMKVGITLLTPTEEGHFLCLPPGFGEHTGRTIRGNSADMYLQQLGRCWGFETLWCTTCESLLEVKPVGRNRTTICLFVVIRAGPKLLIANSLAENNHCVQETPLAQAPSMQYTFPM